MNKALRHIAVNTQELHEALLLEVNIEDIKNDKDGKKLLKYLKDLTKRSNCIIKQIIKLGK